MVLVKAKRDEILGPLSAVSGIIERRHTLPILSNVLIDRSASSVSFLATDIEIQITARSSLAASGEAKAYSMLLSRSRPSSLASTRSSRSVAA